MTSSLTKCGNADVKTSSVWLQNVKTRRSNKDDTNVDFLNILHSELASDKQIRIESRRRHVPKFVSLTPRHDVSEIIATMYPDISYSDSRPKAFRTKSHLSHFLLNAFFLSNTLPIFSDGKHTPVRAKYLPLTTTIGSDIDRFDATYPKVGQIFCKFLFGHFTATCRKKSSGLADALSSIVRGGRRR